MRLINPINLRSYSLYNGQFPENITTNRKICVFNNPNTQLNVIN